MFSHFKNKKFQKIFFLTALWFGLMFLLAVFIFPAGIYSCQDLASIKDISPEKLESSIYTCQLRQGIGALVVLVNFFPALLIGMLIDWLILSLTNLSGAVFGEWFFLLGAIPVAILEIYAVAWLIFRLRSKFSP